MSTMDVSDDVLVDLGRPAFEGAILQETGGIRLCLGNTAKQFFGSTSAFESGRVPEAVGAGSIIIQGTDCTL